MEIMIEIGSDEIYMSVAEAKKIYADLKELLEPTITYPRYIPPLTTPINDPPCYTPVECGPSVFGPIDYSYCGVDK